MVGVGWEEELERAGKIMERKIMVTELTPAPSLC